ncbi:VENN motif pre-toxin domain-containing protein [Nostoc sp. KVJ20]|uniref:VENN motif pre-toxin domain-containing protein n=1 Tax=Nostoc sp. KVJ20 TaxID=457944 RepID=UPI00351F595C
MKSLIVKFIEAALAGAKAEDDITTAVAAKNAGIVAVENRCFMLINVWKRKW